MPLGQAASHEGERVRAEGVAMEIHDTPNGQRLILVGDGARLDVLTAQHDLQEGPLRVDGILARRSGVLALLAEEAQPLDDPGTLVALSLIASDPRRWTDRPVRVDAIVHSNALTDPEGHRLAVARGAFAAGPFDGLILVAYNEACLCYEAAKV
jgi:hypothetical protein